MQAMIVSTLRALMLSGLRKLLTVLEIASTPVSDEPPLANARSTIRRVAPMIRPLPCSTATAPSATCCAGRKEADGQRIPG